MYVLLESYATHFPESELSTQSGIHSVRRTKGDILRDLKNCIDMAKLEGYVVRHRRLDKTGAMLLNGNECLSFDIEELE